MKISVFSPVKNEVDFIGFSVMAVLPYIHEILFACAPSTDGTDDLLEHLKTKPGGEKLKLFRDPSFDFDTKDMAAYNASYNYLIKQATGDALWFLHPDMIVLNPEAILTVPEGPLAWWTHIESYAGDLQTKIASGRTGRWKNIHANQFGLHYFGGYGSQNEDMYFADITGKEYRHYGDSFEDYPFEVVDSGIRVNHYCELKTYARRFEKMKRCLTTLYPNCDALRIEEMAMNHPRVTLEPSSKRFGHFEFSKTENQPPEVFAKYRDEFASFNKTLASV